MFNLRIKRQALRSLEKLDEKRKNRVKEALLNLKGDPLPLRKLDISKLKGYENIYRIRIGALRIVYEVLWTERTIVIQYIGAREKAYGRRT